MMAADDIIPDADHVHRYIGKTKLNESGEVGYAAFLLNKENGEPALSVDWLEYSGEKEYSKCIDGLRKLQYRLRTIKPGCEAQMAILNVGDTRAYISTETKKAKQIDVKHWPTSRNASHSRIYGMELDDNEIAYLLVDRIKELVPVVEKKRRKERLDYLFSVTTNRRCFFS